MGTRVSRRSAVLAVTSTASLTFSGWKWHLWHSQSESNVFTLVGASSPSPEQKAALKVHLKFLSLSTTSSNQRCRILSPGWHEKAFANALFSTASVWGFSLGVFLFIALNLAKPASTHTRMRRQCGSKLLLSDILQCTCHWTFHSDDGQGHVSPLGLSRKAFLNIFCSSCLLDDKMAAAAVLAVLMQRTDTTNFIYCRRAAPCVRHSRSL